MTFKHRFYLDKYYTKLFLYIVIIAFIPIIILSSFFYFSVKNSMEKQLDDYTLNYLKQSENIVEIVFKQLEQSVNQLIVDLPFKEFQDIYNGKYYENISGEFKGEDLPALYSYLDKKRNITRNLEVFRNSNNFIDSLYFYDSSKDIVLTHKPSLQYRFNDFFDKNCFDLIKEARVFPAILDTRSACQYDGSYKNVISIVYKTVNSGSDSFIVVNIDTQYLFNNLAQKVDNKYGGAFFILSEDKNILVNSESDERYKLIDRNLQKGVDSGIYVEKVSNRRFLVTYLKSESLKWFFVTANSFNELYSIVDNIMKLLLIITFLVIVILAVTATISSRKIYAPILNIGNYIKSHIETNSNGNSSYFRSEIDYISESIKRVHKDYMSAFNKLENNLPDYKQKFVQSLLEYNMYSTEEIIEKMKLFDMDLNADNIFVVAINITEPDEEITSLGQLEIGMLKLRKTIEENLSSNRQGILVPMGKNRLAVIKGFNRERFTDIFEWVDKLKQDLVQRCELGFSMGISGRCSSAGELWRAYNEAKEALKYGSINEKYNVIYMDDIKIEGKEFIIFPKNLVELLNNSVKCGDRASTLKYYDEMTGIILKNNSRISYREFQEVLIQTLNRINNTINTLGLELSDIFEGKNLYCELLENTDMKSMNSWFSKILTDTADFVASAALEKKNKYFIEINKFLEANFTENITLNSISEHLKLNPSYLSRMFKEQLGKNFIDYYTEFRIEKSKELLKSTNMKIQDICSTMGYSNSYYFIKVFKQHAGVTPGEYRKMNQNREFV